MRVRPIFFMMLFLACSSVLIFAANVHFDAPVKLQVHLEETRLVSHQATRIIVHLSDSDGAPIQRAQVISSFNMTTMDMGTVQNALKEAHSGEYSSPLSFSMAGSWRIHISVHAPGFTSQSQSVLVNVI
ncbi:FixH family protein [Tengunoibacter tsumagoiensis]|uniref:YtkA-like domain-containing protein n=1 Tax=Tengunoibacter tsumagoiensis TaxID=2014871 RepID=A0A402A5P0_9CHLR|nr:FixH family protein [Tengunoibacter tsumagoiensis]GCE14420.1 hypothetical protein KTT_42790 [Tengunoibacter tsumagoiensis]